MDTVCQYLDTGKVETILFNINFEVSYLYKQRNRGPKRTLFLLMGTLRKQITGKLVLFHMLDFNQCEQTRYAPSRNIFFWAQTPDIIVSCELLVQ